MFTTTNEQSPAVTHGRYKSMIIEDGTASINYDEGYVQGDDFIALGTNHITLQDEAAYTDDTGNDVPANTGYTDFVNDVLLMGGGAAVAEMFIQEQIND